MLRTAIFCLVVTSVSIASAQDFIRADLDGDGRGGTISDARTFGHSVFPVGCTLAWDANDDGSINLADQTFMLNFISPAAPDTFPLPTIPAPGPTNCGPDPTPDNDPDLECTTAVICSGWTPPPVHAERVLEVASAFGAVGGTVTVGVTLDVPTPPNTPGVGAYCFGITHDPTVAMIADVRLGAEYQLTPPDWYRYEVSETGVTITALMSIFDAWVLSGNDLAIHEIDYLLVGAGTSSLTFAGELGVNPSPMMVVDTLSPMFREAWTPTTVGGTLTAEVLPFFLRGDANDDGAFDIADPIAILVGLFTAGAAPACSDAQDVNDDGLINVADGIYALSALFTEGPPPAFPGPEVCGWDPTPDMQPEPCNSSSCP